jgi:Ni,Fe-hydrogenase III large subunit/Ni,Fe-hydrogenase III component G
MTALKDVIKAVSALPEIVSMDIKGNGLEIVVEDDALAPVAFYIYKKFDADLVTMHAVDYRSTEEGFRIYVVFSLEKEDLFVTIRSRVDEKGIFRSLTPQIYAADWYEREIMDMFGLTPLGHPDLRPLVLYDDWPQGVYPLRKDFDPHSKVPRVPNEYHYKKVDGEGVFEIPVGPVHAGVIEPGHFRFSVAGEPVINLEIRLGYVHKGIEKLSEGMPYAKGVYLAERISGDNGVAHSAAYCQAIEKAAGIAIPARAGYMRTVFLEMERAYNHLGDIGGISLDTAYNVGASHAYILKEKMLRLNELVTGSRLLRSVNCIGGVRRDVGEDNALKIRETLLSIKLDFKELVDLITTTPSLLDRVETTGRLSAEAAKGLNIVGPGARASGIDRDVRRDHPYAAYDRLKFRVPVYKEGDVNARMHVKIDEVYESLSIIEQALDGMPSGDISCAFGDIAPGVCGMSLAEAPRGEAVHWIVTGDGKPYRHKIRDPSFCNWLAMEEAVPGNIVPDFPLINKSFNLSYSGNDL